MEETFGSLLRKLRKNKGIGIKKMAPEIDLDYTYLSRIENDKVMPSEQVIARISKYLRYDEDELLLMADKVPDDIKTILRENPQEALGYLRERFAHGKRSGSK